MLMSIAPVQPKRNRAIATLRLNAVIVPLAQLVTHLTHHSHNDMLKLAT